MYSFRRRSTWAFCDTDREHTSHRSNGHNYVSSRRPLLRRHYRLFEVSSADRTARGHFVFITRRDNVFVIVVVVSVYGSLCSLEETFASFSLLPLLLLLLLPFLFLFVICSLKRNNLIAGLVVATIMNELARVSKGAVPRFLVILADPRCTANLAGNRTDLKWRYGPYSESDPVFLCTCLQTAEPPSS